MGGPATGAVSETAPERPFRAVLFDYGGVLTTPIQASFGEFFVETGVNPERLRDVMAEAYAPVEATSPAPRQRGGLIADVETGRLPVAEFDELLAAELSVGLDTPLNPNGLARRLFGTLEPDDEMIDLVRTVRSLGFATALVSNTWGESPGLQSLAGHFDDVVLSHVEGCRKPEPRIYLLAATRLGVEPEVCVFVDDIPTNVEGARAVGMAGVLHRAAAVTIPRLEKLLGVRLGRP